MTTNYRSNTPIERMRMRDGVENLYLDIDILINIKRKMLHFNDKFCSMTYLIIIELCTYFPRLLN